MPQNTAYLVAANGIGAGKTYADLHHSLWVDHRALIESGGQFHLIGGIRDPQAVSAAVVSFRLAPG